MMTFDVLIDELCIHVFSMRNESNGFVVAFSMMNKLVANDAAQRAEEADKKYEAKILGICLRLLKTEPESLWVNIFAHYDHCPNPNKEFEEYKEL